MKAILLKLLSELGPDILKDILKDNIVKYGRTIIIKVQNSLVNENFLENNEGLKYELGIISDNLSREDISKILDEIFMKIKDVDNEDLDETFIECFTELIEKYNIPSETAQYFSGIILSEIIKNLKNTQPEKYREYISNKNITSIIKKEEEMISKLSEIYENIVVYRNEKINSLSLGDMDIELKKSTHNPSIGIDFFIIDDSEFKENFKSRIKKESIYVVGKNIEETIYCVLNELRRLKEKRLIYVIKDKESWEKLRELKNKDNIYIPYFNEKEIIAIENNTNIFVLTENSPSYNKDCIFLRPRTQLTILECLCNSGMNRNKCKLQ